MYMTYVRFWSDYGQISGYINIFDINGKLLSHVLELLLTQNNPYGIKIMSYFKIVHTFLVGLEMFVFSVDT